MTPIENANVSSFSPMPTPAELHRVAPLSDKAQATVERGRSALRDILERKDPRFFAIVGPCSIHDPASGLEYAQRLAKLRLELGDAIEIVMRVYFEKPRTTAGWKGFINDPFMDDSFRIEQGMRMAREFLLRVNELGVPAATEALDPIAPQYLGDLVSWTAIGARTAESQTHREMASGLSTPVGFKNGTDGDVASAINGALSASMPHAFLGIDAHGQVSVARTRGNPHGHVVLRGGAGRPNYDSVSVARAASAMAKAGLGPNLVIDCSHANSGKDPDRQPMVLADVLRQIEQGDRFIVGAMIESHLEGGNQPIPQDLRQLRHGCSVTDACLGWEATERMLRDARERLLRLP